MTQITAEKTDTKGRIVFMGTPEFAVASLDSLIQDKQEVVAVVTVADKLSGRGQKMNISPVKKAALEYGIPVLQPEKLKDSKFIEELSSFNADLFIVVAFRMLPEVVWAMPKLGTFNLHASLLPQYRGAAPINWAIINGEKETGLTTFYINHQIDTGHILLQEKVIIDSDMSAGQLHDKMMIQGGKLSARTANGIFSGDLSATPQDIESGSKLNAAPKIFKADCQINWNDEAELIYNKIRGLSPYPTAWSDFISSKGTIKIKLFEVTHSNELELAPGKIHVSEKSIFIGTGSTTIELTVLQPEGKKKMTSEDFLRGFRDELLQAI